MAFELPAWLNQSNTDLIPNAMAKGTAAGSQIAGNMARRQALKLQAQGMEQDERFRQIDSDIRRKQVEAMMDVREAQAGAARAKLDQYAAYAASEKQGWDNVNTTMAQADEINKDNPNWLSVERPKFFQDVLWQNKHLTFASRPEIPQKMEAAKMLNDTRRFAAEEATRRGALTSTQKDTQALVQAESAARMARGEPPLNPAEETARTAEVLGGKIIGKTQSIKEGEIIRQVADEEKISGREWTEQERVKRTAELRMQTSLAPKSQYHITMDKDGNMVFDAGPGVATVGAQTKFQTELANLQASTQQIETAASSLREKDFGVSGKVWEGINRWVTQIAPEVGDPNVAANRVNVSRAVENYLSTQQAKGRLTADERAEMRQALVSLSAGESFPRAEAVFKRMAKLQRMDAITIAKSGKQALQPWMFQGLEQSKDPKGPNDFGNLVKSGTLTQEEAALWYEKVNPGGIK